MEIEEIKNHLEKLSIDELRNICNFIEDTIESKKLGNIPIGETFKFLGKEYIVKNEAPEDNCEDCAFEHKPYDQTCKYLCCQYKYRHDNQNVIFVKKDNNDQL